jgi:Arc/MetJ family transcription regulator
MHRMMYIRCRPATGRTQLRTTLNLDDTLIEEARRLTGMRERTALIHEGLRALIERESARRLRRLGGSDPELEATRRRRPAVRPAPDGVPREARGRVGGWRPSSDL